MLLCSLQPIGSVLPNGTDMGCQSAAPGNLDHGRIVTSIKPSKKEPSYHTLGSSHYPTAVSITREM